MLFHVEQEEFVNVVTRVAAGLASNNTQPVLGGILMEVEGDALTMRATNLKLDVTVRTPVKVDAAGKAVVNGKYLVDLAKRLPDGNLTIERKGRMVVIATKSGRYQLAIMDPNEFPAAQSVSGISVMLPQPLLRELIRRTASIPDGPDEDAQVYRKAVCMVLKDSELRVTATDGVRIACLTTSVENPAKGSFAVIVPAKTLKEFASMLSSRSGDVRFLVNDKNTAACFEMEEVGTRVWMRLLEGTYPDVMRLVPNQYARIARMPTTEFIEALERASLVKDAVKLNFTQGTCRIEAEAKEVGATQESLPCKLKGDDLTIGFRPVLLSDGIKHLDSNEFQMDMNGPREPIRIQSSVDVGEGRTIEQTYIVLPLVAY